MLNEPVVTLLPDPVVDMVPDFAELPDDPVSISFSGRASDLAAVLVQLDLPVVIDPTYGEQVVNIRSNGEPLSVVAERIAGSLGSTATALSTDGMSVYIGDARESDRRTVLYRVAVDDINQVVPAFQAAGSPNCSALPLGRDGVLVTDVPSAFDRIGRLAVELSQPRPQYVLDVTLVEVSERAALDLGLDWQLSGVADVSVGELGSGATAGLSLRAALAAEANEGGASVVVSQRLLVVEGRAASLQVGETTPVPVRSVSPEGTVTTLDFQQVDTGVLLSVSAARAAGGVVVVDLEPEISSISGVVDGIPAVARRRWNASAAMRPGGVVVLGGLAEAADRDETSGLPFLLNAGRTTKSADRRRLFLFVELHVPRQAPQHAETLFDQPTTQPGKAN
ncbi:MAG: hypothetical protein AAGI46_04525 [Planctomycetota bacterium]